MVTVAVEPWDKGHGSGDCGCVTMGTRNGTGKQRSPITSHRELRMCNGAVDVDTVIEQVEDITEQVEEVTEQVDRSQNKWRKTQTKRSQNEQKRSQNEYKRSRNKGRRSQNRWKRSEVRVLLERAAKLARTVSPAPHRS